MSCMYDVVQRVDAPIVSLDFLGAVHDALAEEISLGRICLGEYDSPHRVLVFCTEEDITEIPSDISAKLNAAWISAMEGPFDVQTKDRVIEPANNWRERHPHLVSNIS